MLDRLRDDAHAALQARRRTVAGAPGVHVFLCTCNDSVHHRDLIEPLAAEARALPGVTGATIVNAACQQGGGQTLAAGLIAGEHGRILLAACLCCPLEILCGSCTHQRARAKGFLFSGEGIPLQLVETVNLRDEVLNQRGLDRDAALRLARRSLAAGVARALAGVGAAAPSPRRRRRRSAAGRGSTPRGATTAPPRSRCRDAPSPPRTSTPRSAAAAGPAPGTARRRRSRCSPRASGIPLARVEPGACTLCGRCLAVCPVGAPDAPLAGHRQIREALAAAFAGVRP